MVFPKRGFEGFEISDLVFISKDLKFFSNLKVSILNDLRILVFFFQSGFQKIYLKNFKFEF